MPNRLLQADRVQSILGAFYDVYKYFKGFGLNETIYANALAYELTLRGHQVEREVRIVVSYKGRRIGKQRLDIVVDRNVIVETKATERLSANAAPQLLSYLRVSPYPVGLLLHFGPRANFRKLVDFPKREIETVRIHPTIRDRAS
jgi:GxxExxY protein